MARPKLIVGIVAMLVITFTLIAASPTQPVTHPIRVVKPTTTTMISTTTMSTTTTLAPTPKRRVFIGNGAGSSQIPASPINTQSLGPCIVHYESGGNPLAANTHSSARGIGQWLSGTWNNWGGYATADLAPLEVQEARLTYDLSLGLAHVRQEWAAQRRNCNF